MLAISRKNLQTIVIDENIIITVVRARNNFVRLGIQAPRSVNIRRGELKPTKQREHEAGSSKVGTVPAA